MTIYIGDKPEMNVVNVGDEITQNAINAINMASSPTAANPFMTSSAVTAGLTGYAQKASANTFTASQTFAATGQFNGAVSVSASGFVPAGTFQNTGVGTALSANASTGTTAQFLNTGGGLAASFSNNANGSVATFENNLLSSTTAVTITNNGTGNSFVVQDSTSPDATSFVIDANGDVTLGGALTLASGAYSASTALGTVTPDYPHELTFKVGSTTYRVPARAI